MKMLPFVLTLAVVTSGVASAAEYECPVTRKVNAENVYTPEQLKQAQLSVLIADDGETAWLTRCSLTSMEGKVNCDPYEVDRIERIEVTSVGLEKQVIAKFYHFSSHFDVQLFGDLFFVENNGRGDIAYGHCERVR